MLYGEPNIIEIDKIHYSTEDCSTYEEEVLTFFNVEQNDTWLNQVITNKNYSTVNKHLVVNEFGVTILVSTTDPKFLNGTYISVHKNKFAAKDQNGEVYYIHVNDPRYISGELVSTTLGKVNVKNKEGKTFAVNITDPRYISGELIPANCGRVTSDVTKCIQSKQRKNFAIAKEVSTGKILGRINIDDPRWKTGEIIGNRNGETNLHSRTHAVAKDSISGICVGSISLDDPRWKTGEIVGIRKRLFLLPNTV